MPRAPVALLKEAKECFNQLEQCVYQLFPIDKPFDSQIILRMNDNGSIENVKTLIVLGGIAQKETWKKKVETIICEPGIYIFFDQEGMIKRCRLDHSMFEYEPWKDNPKLLEKFIERAKDILNSQKKP